MAEMQKVQCNCENSFLDKQLGSGIRWGNPTGKMDKGDLYRCVSCGKEHSIVKHPKKK
jgi:hypothetical protein